MKIIYCGQFRLPNYDAAAPRVLNNARAMRLAGHEIMFISWGGKYRQSDLCSDGKYRIDGMEYLVTDELDFKGSPIMRIKQAMKRGRRTLELLDRMKPNPDVIIMYNGGLRFTSQIMCFCKDKKIKIINDLTEWYDNNELHLWDIVPNYINMTIIQRKIKNKICISSFFNSYYKGNNTIVIPPLCDLSEQKWQTEIEDERILPFKGISLIYAGNPAKKDSVHTIINVVNSLACTDKPIRFIILGITREQYLDRYLNLLSDKTLHDNIIFLGKVNQDLIPAYYKKADFMVLLREKNRKSMAGFPTKFAESMTAGVPVIANATSDLDRYITDGKTGFLLKSDSFEELQKTLLMVLNLDKDQLGYIKRQTIAQNFSFNYVNWKAELDSFLNQLI